MAGDVFEVERILAQDDTNDTYLIKWKGYPDEECTWEPLVNINDEAMQDWQRLLAAGDTLDTHELSILQEKMNAFATRSAATQASTASEADRAIGSSTQKFHALDIGQSRGTKAAQLTMASSQVKRTSDNPECRLFKSARHMNNFRKKAQQEQDVPLRSDQLVDLSVIAGSTFTIPKTQPDKHNTVVSTDVNRPMSISSTLEVNESPLFYKSAKTLHALERITDSSHITPQVKASTPPSLPMNQAQDKYGHTIPSVRDSRLISSMLRLDKFPTELGHALLRKGTNVDSKEIRFYVNFTKTHPKTAQLLKDWLIKLDVSERHIYDHDKSHRSWKQFCTRLDTCLGIILFEDQNPNYSLPGFAKALDYDSLVCWEVQLSEGCPRPFRGILTTSRLFPRGTAIAITEAAMMKELEYCVFVLHWFKAQVKEEATKGLISRRIILPWGYSQIIDDNIDQELQQGNKERVNLWLDLLTAVKGLGIAASSEDADIDEIGSLTGEQFNIILVGPKPLTTDHLENREKQLLEYFAVWTLRYLDTHRRFWAFTTAEPLSGYNHVSFRSPRQFTEKEKARSRR